ncbi:MAG: zinc ABC transporter substrate-binding protein [Deltaproteobacteria bacterium]|nr:zinc ABC transporter substrate-binding protein [Deltaproteobacteria bacterium]
MSVPPQAYFVERIGGDHVRVQVMIPAGASPETYSPTPRQRAGLDRARAYVLVGHPGFVFERVHIRPLLEGRPSLRVIDMMEPLDGAEPAPRERATDPHVWLSPAAVAAAAVEIGRSLVALAPEHGDEFRANLGVFLEEIEELDSGIRESLSAVPPDPAARSFLVVHPAWGWFAREYALVQIAIEAQGKEPGPAELIPLIERARSSRLRVVFVQRGFSQRRARLIAGEIGADVVELDPLARDWLDNMVRVAAALQGALAGGGGSHG